jgi:hypothetical protein
MTEIVPMPDDISLETRRLIGAIAKLKAWEETLPNLKTIKEVEDLRVYSQAVQSIAREKAKQSEIAEWARVGKELEQWAGRVGMMCYRRIGQIMAEMKANKGGQPTHKKSTGPRRQPVEPPPPTIKDLGLSKNFVADAKILASIPEAEFTRKIEEQIANGGIKKQRLIKEARERAKERGETVDDSKLKARAKSQAYDRVKASQRNQKRPPKPRLSPSQKFERYWTKEQRLLEQFFETTELEKIGGFWWQTFQTYRTEKEKILLDYQQERERKKALAELAKP